MAMPAWETLTPEQQRMEWDRFNAWRAPQLQAPPPAPSWPPMQNYLPQPNKRTPKWPLIVGIPIILALLACIVATAVNAANRTTLHGDMTVVTNTNALTSVGINEGCMTFAGYDDVAEGASVVVRDSNNAVVATGSLSRGKATTGGCVFSFSIPDVPNSDFYSVEVTHRGAITVSGNDVQSGVHMTLGG